MANFFVERFSGGATKTSGEGAGVRGIGGEIFSTPSSAARFHRAPTKPPATQAMVVYVLSYPAVQREKRHQRETSSLSHWKQTDAICKEALLGVLGIRDNWQNTFGDKG